MECCVTTIMDPFPIIKNRTDMICEHFIKYIFIHNKWHVGKIPLNAFIAHSKKHQVTTSGGIEWSDKYNIFYKYIGQLETSHKNLSLWESGKRYRQINDDIVLT